MKRVEANDADTMDLLADGYHCGEWGLQQNRAKAMELYAKAAELGSSDAHFSLGNIYSVGGDSKKSKFHYEAAATAGHDVARNNLGNEEGRSGNVGRGLKHLKIAASAGQHQAMHTMLVNFKRGFVSRDEIDSTLAAYNASCAEMRSEARDTWIRVSVEKVRDH